ncbi:TRAP transporter small permease subunit [Xanthobacter tagetidis]|jgi:TRAP-type mannitol/chloroaromatic compound transport system permease small subunit|uniref:TRAP transporter small permease protein n=1 Tax=Xanthobacter tagetidis TaxID=60216 RepID=A0A3L7AKP0_9HYPH|nr:TRAP transporter small permease subunit [Xanthobacter tagetidis]MBB6307517.1 TRAP-type mannitol/chloroaromatic compound transport system permease small subunit [Xanthobacter tagetidis]RLP81093.1 TRAP transporter small permease subunit [Xanthobacter tagetidis]
MQRFLLAVDTLNTFIGKLFAWTIVILTLAICYEVFCRYVLRAPTTWAYDASYMLYGTLFMMAGAYTLARNGHVRGDFLYRSWPVKRQALVDLILYFLFYFPGIIALIYSGWQYFYLSFLLNEHSSFSPDGPMIWPFKGLIPITGVLMFLQGVVEVVRCTIALRTGQWPERLHDVEEMEKMILEDAANKSDAEAIGRGSL